MAKRTAVIDLGSNSVRMVIFEKSSRFGFHLIKEIKSRVRVGEGAYEQGGLLQEGPMQRTFEALRSFHTITQNLGCSKILCVATSALRDAPNATVFTHRVQKELGLHIRIIDGSKEAYYGAVAATNLLEPLEEATTIDIGGGSTELAKIEKGKIVDTISLDIGTVRLKELFFDTKKPKEALLAFIHRSFDQIPQHFTSPVIVAIGGTLRSLASAIMETEAYPLQTVHGFSYEYPRYASYIETLSHASILDLKPYPFKKDRLDTIREGASIFQELAKKMDVQKIITCGAGVREGVYLSDLLRNHHHAFPANFNISVKSLQDRFSTTPKHDNYVMQCALDLFDALAYLHGVDERYKYELGIAAKLNSIGRSLSFYQEHLHSFYFILNNLNFGFSHEQKMLIALLLKYHSKRLPDFKDLEAFERLLPDVKVVNWLSFILAFAKFLNTDFSNTPVTFSYENHTLHVKSDVPMLLAKESIKKLVKPASFAIAFR